MALAAALVFAGLRLPERPAEWAAAYAQVGATDEALGWLERAVRVRGWVDYVYFTRHDRFLERVRATPRFQELMAFARERHQRVEVALPAGEGEQDPHYRPAAIEAATSATAAGD